MFDVCLWFINVQGRVELSRVEVGGINKMIKQKESILKMMGTQETFKRGHKYDGTSHRRG